MKLNHVNLPVPDVSATRDFFEQQFGLHCIAEPTDANVVLTDGAGLVLTISNFDHANEITYPKWFHVGFMQDSDDKVDDIYDRLKMAGMQPSKPASSGDFRVPKDGEASKAMDASGITPA